MRLFTCPACGATAYFSNLRCLCGAELRFDPDAHAFVNDGAPCANREAIGCGWVADGPAGLCRSCAMTEVAPDTFHRENLALWARAEAAKRWVLATLGRWGWFSAADEGPAPRFHLLSEMTAYGPARVVMGHESGLVTINLAEADPVETVRRREAFSEALRTMTAHFRHEIAHFLFERLDAARPGFRARFEALFGDPEADYGAALRRHYDLGPPADWNAKHISPYASSHPHEDWAETAAHVMHLADMLDSALSAGLARPPFDNLGYDAYAETGSGALLDAAAEYGVALNHVNRSMGLGDIYPFVHSPVVREKLIAAHGWISGAAG